MPVSIAGTLRSIAIGVTDLAAAGQFYSATWRLTAVARDAASGAVYLRGSGADHHILALHPRAKPEVLHVDFNVAQETDLAIIAARVEAAGGSVLHAQHANPQPDGGQALTIIDPQGRQLRFLHGAAVHSDTAAQADAPVRITHVVFNSENVAAAQTFYEQALGFALSDRTRIMAFMRCGADHHSIALADASDNTLNHIAFVMPDLESVMRGAGRMRDAGYPIEWGIGRHGPGNNVFAYFIGPDDFVIEYTAEVLQIDDSYRVGHPEDWTWPAGRFDQWGVSAPPSARIKQAQKTIRFPQP